MPEPFWWRSLPDDAKWQGVFQGGGARGAGYAGALMAFAKRRQWFDAAAGSSAGALTAALVAAGFHPDEFAEVTNDLLGRVRPATTLDRLVNRTKWTRPLTRFDSQALEDALEGRLRQGLAEHGGDAEEVVTFASLFRATGIALYVVVLDATRGRPVPFCAEYTPDLPVASAVISSCSIPIAFSPRHMEVDQRSAGFMDSPTFRRLVDGGAWANFPAFVFADPVFRQFFHLEPQPEPRIMGFVLGFPPFLAATPSRFVEDPTRHPLGKLLLTPGPMVREDDWTVQSLQAEEPTGSAEPTGVGAGRLRETADRAKEAAVGTAAVAIQLALVAGVLALGWLGLRPLVAAQMHPAWRVLGAFVLAAAVALLIVLAALRRVSRALLREGIDTFKSLMGLATAPAIWVGHVPGSAVLYVPAPRLTTTGFAVEPAVLKNAVEVAEWYVSRDLEDLLAGESYIRKIRAAIDDAVRSGVVDAVPELKQVPTHLPRFPR